MAILEMTVTANRNISWLFHGLYGFDIMLDWL